MLIWSDIMNDIDPSCQEDWAIMQLQYHPKAANLAAQNNVVPANGIKVKDGGGGGRMYYVRTYRHT